MAKLSDRDPGANEAIRRRRIEMFYLADRAGDGAFPIVRRGSRSTLVRIYNALARQFRHETRFDFAPYMAETKSEQYDDWDEPAGVLIQGEDLIARGRLIAGVVGLERGRACAELWQLPPERWRLAWVYLHPHERGLGRVEHAWSAVLRNFGPVALVDDPHDTAAGRVLLARLRRCANAL